MLTVSSFLAEKSLSRHDRAMASLVLLSENQDWWLDMNAQLEYPRRWDDTTNSTMAWVFIAYAFVVIDSFTGDIVDSLQVNGQGIGTLWLWILPIVFAWQKVSPRAPTSDGEMAGLVHRINSANAYSMAHDGQTHLMDRDWAISVIGKFKDSEAFLYRDQACTAPIYNYSRIFRWTKICRTITAMFKASNAPSSSLHDVNTLAQTTKIPSMWESGVFRRIGLSLMFALLLQWGTAGSAIIVVWYTPTTGKFVLQMSAFINVCNQVSAVEHCRISFMVLFRRWYGGS
jgi:hypothetical protein